MAVAQAGGTYTARTNTGRRRSSLDSGEDQRHAQQQYSQRLDEGLDQEAQVFGIEISELMIMKEEYSVPWRSRNGERVTWLDDRFGMPSTQSIGDANSFTPAI